MHYYKFNIGDYHTHTQHLDPIEDIAYRRMLDWYYLHESPLPDNVDQIARLIRMRSHTDSIAIVLEEFFELSDYGWKQAKADKEIEAFQKKSEKAKASAEARWSAKPVKSNANASKVECEGNANHKPLTTNQEPLIPFDQFWSIYPKKVGKAEANKKWDKLKVDSELFDKIKDHIFSAFASTDKQFIPNASTYLNQKRYLDEVESVDIPFNEIVDIYHQACPTLTKVVHITDKMKSNIEARWSESDKHSDMRFWGWLFDKVSKDQFYSGESSTGWKASLDYLTEQETFYKIIGRAL